MGHHLLRSCTALGTAPLLRKHFWLKTARERVESAAGAWLGGDSCVCWWVRGWSLQVLTAASALTAKICVCSQGRPGLCSAFGSTCGASSIFFCYVPPGLFLLVAFFLVWFGFAFLCVYVCLFFSCETAALEDGVPGQKCLAPSGLGCSGRAWQGPGPHRMSPCSPLLLGGMSLWPGPCRFGGLFEVFLSKVASGLGQPGGTEFTTDTPGAW